MPAQLRYFDVISGHAIHTPDATAIEDDGQVLTYRDLWVRASSAAAWLDRAGVRPGNRVAIAAAPGADAVVVLLGCMIAGAVAAPMNPRFSATEADAYLQVLTPSIVIGDVTGEQLLSAIAARPNGPETMSLPEVCEGFATPIPDAGISAPDGPRPHDVALVVGTGGTTGTPKAAMWSHRSLWLYGASCAHATEIRRTDVELFFSPFFHIVLSTGPLSTLYAGGTVRFLPGFDTGRVAAEVASGRVTRFFAPPTALVRLLAHPSFDATRTDSVRRILFGSTRSEPSLIAQLTEGFPRAELVTGYGATEFGGVLRLRSWERGEADGPEVLGWPVPGVRVRIVGPGGDDLPLGETGEIVVHAPWQMDGYLGAADAEPFHEGGVRSGDLAVRRADGSIVLQGRSKDLIITGGENVFPVEVEGVLSRHPAVEEAAVFGLPDEDWGERVEAAVVIRESASAEAPFSVADLREFARQHLAGYKVPKRIQVVASMPLTAAMKIDKRALRAHSSMSEIAVDESRTGVGRDQ